MVPRIIQPLKNHSFFLFGARGTGKTYFLERYLDSASTLSINLLDPEVESRLALEPNDLVGRVEALPVEVIERPGLSRALIETKSTDHVREEDVWHLVAVGKDIPNSETFCMSRNPTPKIVAGVRCLTWQTGLVEIGL